MADDMTEYGGGIMRKSSMILFLAVSFIFLLNPAVCLAENETESSLISPEDEQNKIFEGWVTEGETFQASGLDVFVSSGSSGEGIFLFPQKTLMLMSGKCDKVDRLRVCMYDWEYLRSGKIKTHGDDLQKFLITVAVPAPSISISRQAGETSLEVGESTRVTVTLTNGGDQPALGITYTETVPSEFSITMTNGMSQQGRDLFWHGSIPSGGEVKFAYNILAKSGFAGEINAVLEYKVNEVPKKIEDGMMMKITSLMDIGQRLDAPSMQFGEENRVYVTIENKRSEDLDADVYVTFPEELSVVASNFNKSNEGTYSWSGSMDGGSEQTFITRFKAEAVGQFKINVSVHGVFVDSKIANAQEDIDINVSVKDAELYFIPKSVKVGEESDVKLYLKNPNTLSEFSDIDVWAESDYFNGTGHLAKYRVNQYDAVLSFKVKPESTGSFKAKADATYYIGGKKFTVSKEESIKVEEAPEPEPEPGLEPEPVADDNTTADNETKKDEPKQETKQLFAVISSVSMFGRVKDSIALVFRLRESITKMNKQDTASEAA